VLQRPKGSAQHDCCEPPSFLGMTTRKEIFFSFFPAG
jgi:hypothetical protein